MSLADMLIEAISYRSTPRIVEFTTQLDQCSCPIAEHDGIRQATWLERFKIRYQPKFRCVQQTKVAELVARRLQEAQRERPRAVYKGRPGYIIKEWIRRNRSIDKATLESLKSELVAYRLGITTAQLNNSNGLQHFSESREKQAFLYNYLSFYRHKLKTNTTQNSVQVRIQENNGAYAEWNGEKTQALINADPIDQSWPSKYGNNGLQNDSLTSWIDPETRAFTHKKHPSCGKYLFSYCVYSSTIGPRCQGDHSWFRLTTPEGKIYEFGKYRPPGEFIKSEGLIKKEAVIQSPDCSSMWPVAPNPKNNNGEPELKHTDGTHRTKIHFEITKGKFESALKKITDLKKENKLFFGLVDESCVVLTHQIAETCGIKIDSRASVYKLVAYRWFIPKKLIPLVEKICQFVPELLGKILYFIPGVIMNCLIYVTFGGYKGPKEMRHFKTIGDFFNPEKTLINHPWYLATQVKARVEEARRGPQGSFDIPEKFRV